MLPEPHLAFAWRAFHDLSGDRALGYGTVGRIPFTAVDRYAARFGVSGADEFERFFALVRAMDIAFVDWATAKAGEGK